MAINEKYSFKDFLDQSFAELSASEFNNSEIKGSCFYQQVAPNTQVFPDGITGVTFTRCNLDNVLIPSGNIVESDCSHRKIKVQNDLEDWVVDDSLKPIEPVNKKIFEELGLSTDPKDIPVDFIRREIVIKSDWLKTKDLPEVTDWYLETPQIINQETKQSTNVVLRTEWDLLADKSILTGKYDEAPSINMAKADTGEDVVVIKGNITWFTIEGKGLILIQGKKQRPFTNLLVTQAKEESNKQADIDALKAFDPALARRLGIK